MSTRTGSRAEEIKRNRKENPLDVDIFEKIFGNDLILSQIFKKLDVQQLKQNRLVSSRWNKVASAEIRNQTWSHRTFLIFREKKEILNFIKTYEYNPKDILYSCFKFRTGGQMHTHLFAFFNQFSHQMKILDLRYCFKSIRHMHSLLIKQNSLIELSFCAENTPADVLHPPKVKSFKIKQELLLPKLEYLEFRRMKLYEEVKRDEFVLKFLLNVIPNETIIKIIEYGNLNTTLEIFQNRNVKAVEFVEVIGSLNLTNFESIIEKGIKLEALELPKSFTMRSSKFLGSQSNTLRAMIIETQEKFLFEYTMPLLVKLKLSAETRSQLEFNPFSNINFNKTFPNLKVLQIDTKVLQRPLTAAGIGEFTPQLSYASLSLRELVIAIREVNVQWLNYTFAMCPRITKLKISNFHLSNNNFEIFQSVWRSSFAATLEEFEVSEWVGEGGEFVLDRLFSGLNIDRIYSVFDNQAFNPPDRTSSAYQRLDSACSFNSIRRLENLKILKLHPTFWIYPEANHKLTDFTAHFLFGKMEKLIWLELGNKIAIMSPTAKEYLEGKGKIFGSPPIMTIKTKEDKFLEKISKIG